jgi:predicted ATPase
MKTFQTMQSTGWIVLTGAPCSGKTAVVNALQAQGYQVVAETARTYIDAQLRRGLSLSQIKADPLRFEQAILRRKMAVESGLPPEATIFLDRAVPDSIAYFTAAGLAAREPLAASRRVRYRKVFLLRRLPFIRDTVRGEDAALAVLLERLLHESYTGLGYRPIPVPALAVPERVAFILQHL